MEALLSNLALAGAITDAGRMTHESTSRGILHVHDGSYGMGDWRDATGQSDSTQSVEQVQACERLKTYTELAGNPKRIGEFICWSASIAPEGFEHTDAQTVKKIGLDLGGMRQAGNWSGTGPIDDMAATIPDAVRAEQPESIVIETEKGKQVRKTYEVAPLDHYSTGSYNPNFSYALITRTRSAATIDIPGVPHMDVWKVSHAMLVLSQLGSYDEKELAVFRESYATAEQAERMRVKNSTPAGIGGRAFDAVIPSPDRSESTLFVPVSANFFVTMDRPGTSLPEDI